jgi:hypothetical protein
MVATYGVVGGTEVVVGGRVVVVAGNVVVVVLGGGGGWYGARSRKRPMTTAKWPRCAGDHMSKRALE